MRAHRLERAKHDSSATATPETHVVRRRQKKAHGGTSTSLDSLRQGARRDAARTALWDARPSPAPACPRPRRPRQHPDESEDDFRARLETVRQLRDRLETDDRMNLACECAKRGVAFDGDDSAAMLRRRLAQDLEGRTRRRRRANRAARRGARRSAGPTGPSGDYPVARSWTRSALGPSCPRRAAPRARRRDAAARSPPPAPTAAARHELGRPRRGLAGLGPGARARGD